MQHDVAIANRKALLDRAANDKIKLLGFHWVRSRGRLCRSQGQRLPLRTCDLTSEPSKVLASHPNPEFILGFAAPVLMMHFKASGRIK